VTERDQIAGIERGGPSEEADVHGRRLAELVVTVARSAAAIEQIRFDLSIGGLGAGADPAAQATHAAMLRRVQARLEETERALQTATDELTRSFAALHAAKPRG
jgi:hypothetical protein